ncbi:hypothetical protein D3874_14030 [Oleomonas cavernae]|uniref:Uncharacterized protein n=1 Tax=Oleomonas cavernae TaxID=2320859 RepID=A0A418WDA9_9PROT|nr:hypothetical protein [Oleomonas cavernae]RJF88003.1 hypothetical protein D3874_14030 [Oleomonas cavernae]
MKLRPLAGAVTSSTTAIALVPRWASGAWARATCRAAPAKAMATTVPTAIAAVVRTDLTESEFMTAFQFSKAPNPLEDRRHEWTIGRRATQGCDLDHE